MKNNLFDKSKIIIVLSLSFLFFGFFVFAQENKNQTGLSISPLRFEFSADPGDTIENVIKVTNPTKNTVSVKMEVEDFTAMGEEGQVKVEEQKDHTYSLKRWVTTTPSEFTLAPNESKVVNFKIVVPKNAEPGGKYGSILATVTGVVTPEGTGASIQPKVGSLVLLSVSGKIVENLDIKEFSAPKFLDKGPVKFTLRFENKGTVHLRPRGIVSIYDIFGKKLADLEIPQQNVLPGAIRKVEVEWKKGWLFGFRYRAMFVGSYGSQNQPLSASLTFYAFPWIWAGIIILILALLIFYIVRTQKKVKKAKEILKKYQEKESGSKK